MRYRTNYEHRHGGQPCDGSGQESKSCNAWVDTKSDLLTCETKFEKYKRDKQAEEEEFVQVYSGCMETNIRLHNEKEKLIQQLNNNELSV